MDTMSTPTLHGPSANDRLKANFSALFWEALVLATLLHFVVLRFFPLLPARDIAFSATAVRAIDIPPDVEMPPPPEQIARPAVPVVSTVALDEELTIAPTTFEYNPVEHLPPPSAPKAADLAAGPVFTPFTVAPELRNREAVGRALERHYPPALRQAGISGRTLVWFFLDVHGKVVKAQVKQSSGYSAFDEAALAVADLMIFSPAQNRDRYVPVWVALPIDFRSH
jgi:TonB family protein